MPLDRKHVTAGQRVMVLVNATFAGGLGLGYTFIPGQLEKQPTYASAAQVLPLPFQGVGFLVISALLVFALITHRRGVYVAGLAWMLVWLVAWVLICIRATAQGQASVLAAWWPAYVVCACWASMVALISREN